MTKEEKELVIIDLSGRLKHGVKLDFYARATRQHYVCTLLGIEPDGDRPIIAKTDDGAFTFTQDHVKPYLRKMSSMTEEEKQELERLIDEKLNGNTDQEDDEWTPWVLHDTTGIRNSVGGERFYFDEMSFIYDWLNAHHFDYRGLIEKGLALEAPEGMYKF